MAAEALEKKAKELGYRIKVETRAPAVPRMCSQKQKIAEAECIIVAADTQVPMDRFAGKPVIQCKVADGISKAEELLTKRQMVMLLSMRQAEKQQMTRKKEKTVLDIRFTSI